ncbi:TIGR02679 domain-containing protein [Streptomyces erythrogriseus]
MDTRLRASAAGRGLTATLEALGPPLTDRRAARDAAAAERSRVWSTARTELESTSLSDRPWAAQWLEDLRRGGTLTRQDPHTATTVVTQAIRTLAALFPEGDTPPPRPPGAVANWPPAPPAPPTAWTTAPCCPAWSYEA